MAFRRKQDYILDYDPDVVIIQESENPDYKGDWSEFTDWKWIGENRNKGLGIFTRNGFCVEEIETKSLDSKYFLPVEITDDLKLLGVWAMNDEGDPRRRYIGQVYTAVQDFDFLDSKTIVAGDWNWNIEWDDSPSSPLYGNFKQTVRQLAFYGLSSAYHDFFDAEYGDEDHSTFFMHKKEDREYHTDYIFYPQNGNNLINLQIGEYEDWIDHSDHMPMFLEYNT